ncbi:MAG: DUF4340 domain-containing protein [Verrucomicrobiae bacterium]|nr:DUF4340 domain-containing protein [Verrucomicrobiae bacterium]
MKTKTTLILIAVAALLLGFIFFKERQLKTHRDWEIQSVRVFDFKPEEVTALRFESPEGAMTVQFREGQWKITDPVTDRGDLFFLKTILRELSTLESRRKIPKAEVTPAMRSADFQLEKPRLKIRVTRPQGDLELGVGAEAPAGGGFFVGRESGGDVFLLSPSFKAIANLKLSDLRDKSVLGVDPSLIERMEIKIAGEGGTSRIVEAFAGGKGWRLSKPINVRAHPEKMEALLNELHQARIQGFVSEGSADLKAFGLAEPSAVVTLHVKGQKEPLVLLLGLPVRENPKMTHAKIVNRNVVVTLPTELVKALLPQPNDLRNTTLAEFDPETVTRLVITSGKTSLELRKQNGSWVIAGEPVQAADTAVVETLLDQLLRGTVSSFVTDVPASLKTYGLDPAAQEIQVWATGGDGGETKVADVKFGRKDPKSGVYARSGEEMFVSAVRPEYLQNLPAGRTAYLDRQIFSINPALLREATLTLKEGPVTLVAGPGGWKLSESSQGVINSSQWEQLLLRLAPLRAVTVVAVDEKEVKRSGLDRPTAVLTLRPVEGEATVLKIGAETPSKGYYAQVEGRPTLYEIPAELVRLVVSEIILRPQARGALR